MTTQVVTFSDHNVERLNVKVNRYMEFISGEEIKNISHQIIQDSKNVIYVTYIEYVSTEPSTRYDNFSEYERGY